MAHIPHPPTAPTTSVPPLPSSAAISAFISTQRAILLQNLTHQRKSLIVLIHGRETELQILSTMASAQSLLKNEESLGAEITILKRRLAIVQRKEEELRRLQREAGDAMEKERKLSRNHSKKIDITPDASWI